MGLWTLLEGCLLLANALAILNEDRFLAPRGWSFQEYSGVRRNSFKGQLLGLIYATQYLRVLLILLNTLCIVVKFVSGWWFLREVCLFNFVATFWDWCVYLDHYFWESIQGPATWSYLCNSISECSSYTQHTLYCCQVCIQVMNYGWGMPV